MNEQLNLLQEPTLSSISPMRDSSTACTSQHTCRSAQPILKRWWNDISFGFLQNNQGTPFKPCLGHVLHVVCSHCMVKPTKAVADPATGLAQDSSRSFDHDIHKLEVSTTL
jgi:hypothetical protein